MNEDSTAIEQTRTGKFFIPSLLISRFSTRLPSTLLSLLLIEIGLTFGLQVGIVGQISAARSLVALIASFVVGALSVKYNHKRLLMAGLFTLILSAVNCAFSTSYYTMLFFSH